MSDETFKHDEHKGLLHKIAENTNDTLPTLVHADWLEEHDKPTLASVLREHANVLKEGGYLRTALNEGRNSETNRILQNNPYHPVVQVQEQTHRNPANNVYELTVKHLIHPEKEGTPNIVTHSVHKKAKEIKPFVEALEKEGAIFHSAVDQDRDYNFEGRRKQDLPDYSFGEDDPNYNKHYARQLNSR
jgi:uncharacterized protein (TIGR02996 family)